MATKSKHYSQYFFIEPPVQVGDGTGFFVVRLSSRRNETILRKAVAAARSQVYLMTKASGAGKVKVDIKPGRDTYTGSYTRTHVVWVEDESRLNLTRHRVLAEMQSITQGIIDRSNRRNATSR